MKWNVTPCIWKVLDFFFLQYIMLPCSIKCPACPPKLSLLPVSLQAPAGNGSYKGSNFKQSGQQGLCLIVQKIFKSVNIYEQQKFSLGKFNNMESRMEVQSTILAKQKCTSFNRKVWCIWQFWGNCFYNCGICLIREPIQTWGWQMYLSWGVKKMPAWWYVNYAGGKEP